jgi:hypothetical protein
MPFASCPASGSRRPENAEAMTIRVQCHESAAEIHVGRLLYDRQPTAAPIHVDGIDVIDGYGQLASAHQVAAGSTV